MYAVYKQEEYDGCTADPRIPIPLARVVLEISIRGRNFLVTVRGRYLLIFFTEVSHPTDVLVALYKKIRYTRCLTRMSKA